MLSASSVPLFRRLLRRPPVGSAVLPVVPPTHSPAIPSPSMNGGGELTELCPPLSVLLGGMAVTIGDDESEANAGILGLPVVS